MPDCELFSCFLFRKLAYQTLFGFRSCVDDWIGIFKYTSVAFGGKYFWYKKISTKSFHFHYLNYYIIFYMYICWLPFCIRPTIHSPAYIASRFRCYHHCHNQFHSLTKYYLSIAHAPAVFNLLCDHDLIMG